jgi:N-acetylneuraminate lyase
MINKTIGLIAAPFTPMTDDCSVNLDIIEQQADSLFRNNVIGAFLCGTTGEGLSLTVEERMQVFTRWAQVAPKDMIVIAHIGHNCLADAKSLARHARDAGLHAVGILPPMFYKPSSVDHLVDWCAQVAAETPQLPFYYYHIPSMTGVNVSITDFLNAAKNKIPNLAGAKFTHYDLADFASCLALEDHRFDMLFGRDEMLLAGLALGAKGAVGSTYNFAAPLYTKLIDAFNRNDLDTARTLQQKSIEMVNILVQTPCSFLTAAKSVMKMTGLDLGPNRLPLPNITSQEYDKLEDRLTKINFFDYACK